MKSLFIFDCHPQDIRFTETRESIDLFPFTGDAAIVSAVSSQIKALNIPGAVLNSATQVDQAVTRLRERMASWTTHLGQKTVAGKPLSEWFDVQGGQINLWPASSFVEKSPFKSDVFLKLAQLDAIKALIRSGQYDECIVCVSDKNQRRALCQFLQKNNIKVLFLKAPAHPRPWRQWLKSFDGFFHLYSALIWLFENIQHGWVARRALKSKRPLNPQGLFVISYFPYLDLAALEKGDFKNKYTGPLAEKCMEWGRPINWVLIPVPMEGAGFKDAVHLAARLQEKGHPLAVLHEFMTLKVVIKGFLQWFVLALKGRCLSLFFPKDFLSRELTEGDFELLLRKYWQFNMAGDPQMSAAIYLFAFQELIKKNASMKCIVYPSERQVWEKILEMVTAQSQQPISTIAFQHSSFSRNFFPYFNSESHSPSLLACNGAKSKAALSPWKYKKVVQVEALRHFYLQRDMNDAPSDIEKERSILFSSSYDRLETVRILQMLNSLKDMDPQIQIQVRLHPVLSLPEMVTEAGIDDKNIFEDVTQQSLIPLLKSSSLVVAGRTSIAMESLVYGCQVILPLFPDVIFSSPLREDTEYYVTVSSPQELKSQIERGLKNTINPDQIQKNRTLAKQYWDLDPSLKKWESVIKKYA